MTGTDLLASKQLVVEEYGEMEGGYPIMSGERHVATFADLNEADSYVEATTEIERLRAEIGRLMDRCRECPSDETSGERNGYTVSGLMDRLDRINKWAHRAGDPYLVLSMIRDESGGFAPSPPKTSSAQWTCSCGATHPDDFDKCVPGCGGLRTWTEVSVPRT
jgi:hypothetical protein